MYIYTYISIYIYIHTYQYIYIYIHIVAWLEERRLEEALPLLLFLHVLRVRLLASSLYHGSTDVFRFVPAFSSRVQICTSVSRSYPGYIRFKDRISSCAWSSASACTTRVDRLS